MDLFKVIIKELTPLLKKINFNKKGNSFYLESEKNFGIINFQKGRYSTKDTVVFTINFGIYSDVIGQLQYDYSNTIKPEVNQCHWEARIGNFIPNKPDYWWKFNLSDDIQTVILSIMETVENIIMPEINKRLSDDGLINSWLNENFAGTTEIGRFKYLTILLKTKGDFKVLNNVIERFMQEMKGKPNANLAMEHLKEINVIYQI